MDELIGKYWFDNFWHVPFAYSFWKSDSSQEDSCVGPGMRASLNTKRVDGISSVPNCPVPNCPVPGYPVSNLPVPNCPVPNFPAANCRVPNWRELNN